MKNKDRLHTRYFIDKTINTAIDALIGQLFVLKDVRSNDAIMLAICELDELQTVLAEYLKK